MLMLKILQSKQIKINNKLLQKDYKIIVLL